MRKRPLVRRLSSLGRVFVALVLLGALWFGTVRAVDDATKQGQKGRLTDRLLLTKTASTPVAEWVAASRRETQELQAAVGAARGQAARAAIDAYLAKGPVFARSAVMVDAGGLVVAASADRAAAVGRKLVNCSVTAKEDASLEAEEDASVERLVGGAGLSATPLIALPGTCHRGVAVGVPVPAANATLIAFGQFADLRTRAAQSAAAAQPFHVTVVDPAGATVTPTSEEPGSASPEMARFAAGATPRTGRLFARDAEVVAAFHPAGEGWGVVVDQPANTFDVAPNKRPALAVAAMLTGAFAVAFAIVAWFDLRRRRAARRADADRDAFLAIVGHELRTPLTVIKGYTETLATRWDALDDRSRQMLVESLAPQTQRQARVIEHLLTAASLQAGIRPGIGIAPTEVGPVVAAVVAEAKALAPLHVFDVHVDAALPAARAEGSALAQALGELVDNAVRFSPSGGSVAVSVQAHRRGIEIVVDDEGVGLPARPETLFRAFTQAEDVDQRLHAEGGVGVGLFIARSLVEQMGGSVRAEARPGGGARFVVRLAAASATRSTSFVRARP